MEKGRAVTSAHPHDICTTPRLVTQARAYLRSLLDDARLSAQDWPRSSTRTSLPGVMTCSHHSRLCEALRMYEELTRTMNKQERSLLTELLANTKPPLTLAGTVKWVFVWTGGMVLCGSRRDRSNLAWR